MESSEARRRILRWEVLRVPFNLVCIAGASLFWNVVGGVTVAIDELPAPTLADPGAMQAFAFGFGVLNAAYCLIYAVEFVALAVSERAARASTVAAYIIGCALGFVIAVKGSVGIAHSLVTEKRISLEHGARAAEFERMKQQETQRRNEASAQEKSAQAPR